MVVRRWQLALAVALFATSAKAEVVSEWNQKAESFVVEHKLPAPRAGRITAMVQIAVFEALNSITPRYRPYIAKLPANGSENPDAAAAAAAAGVMIRLDPANADKIRSELDLYVAFLQPGAATEAGLKLGDAAAAAIVAARANDGSDAIERYRPKTAPGVYIPTAPLAVPHWPGVKPFAIPSATAFRPAPPPKLTSKTWKSDLAEIRQIGGLDSKARSAKQTEDAKFWLTVGPQAYMQVSRQFAAAKGLTGVDAARFMAVVEIARADSILAVFDAKYHYGFWRPVTAIRVSFETDDAWLPIDATPAHPEYPCAHCISSASIAAVAQKEFGGDNVPEFRATSPTAPGVVHSWTSLKAFNKEVSEARIWAGFHYRFSTRVAEDMGSKIGTYVAENIMQPVPAR
jgi:hypothetical protein